MVFKTQAADGPLPPLTILSVTSL